MLQQHSGTRKFWQGNIRLVPIILVGFAVRLYRLGAQSLWYDETVSAFLAAQPPAELIAHTARDIHPPGYYLLLHFWAMAAGRSEFALAFFSLLFGVLLIPLTYLLAQRLLNRAGARWAAFLVAVSPYNIWYSQEVRMYTLGAALGLLATFWALRGLPAKAPAARRYWLGYLVAASVGLYALYYFAFLLAVVNLFLLVYSLRPSFKAEAKAGAVKGLFAANGLLLLTYLPWVPIAWKQATNPPVPPWRSPPAFWDVALESWSALSLGQSVEPAQVWPILLLALALFILGLRATRRPAYFLAAYTFGPLLIIYLLSFITPLYHVRYLFTYSPPFYMVLGAGLAWLSGRAHRAVAPAVAAVLLGGCIFSVYQFHVDPHYRADDFRSAVQFIERHWQPGDVILANAGYTYTAFSYYTDFTNLERRRLVPYRPAENAHRPLLLQTGTVNGPAQLGWGDPHSDFYAMSSAQTVAALEQVADEFARLWMLRAYDTVTDPNATIRTWLARHATPLEDELFSGPSNIRAQGFLLNPPPPPKSESIFFEDGMALAGRHVPQQAWQPGQTIHLKLWWTTTAPPHADYKMSLKLWTPAGALAAQGRDEWPVGRLYRATDWPVGKTVYHPTQLTLPATLPPGQYWLNVELYHPETVQPLLRQDTGQAAVTLGLVPVD